MCLMFQSKKRVAVVQPTGTGKSFLYLKWMEEHTDQNILVISPSHYIFQQLERYQKQSNTLFAHVSYMTYAKLSKLTDWELQDLQPDMVVLDEFHRCGAPEWGRGVQALLDCYREVKVLGTSATPIRYLDSCRDMAQEVFEDHYAVHMSIGEALKEKILPTPIYIASYYSFLGELEQLEERARATGNERLRLQLFHKINKAKRMLIEKECTLEGIFRKHLSNPSGRYIVFCSSEMRLKEAMDTCEAWFSSYKVAVHKYQVLSSYHRSMEEFQTFEQDKSEDAIKLLFCVDMLNEGIHIEGIDGVIMLRTTESLNVYYQQLGRALTCMGNTIKRPLIFDLVNNFENGNAGALEQDLLYSLCTELDDGDDEFEFELYDYIVDLRQALEEIKKTFEMSWEYNYESVKAFYQEHQRFPYNRELYHGIDLGSWCIVQRRQYQSGNLLNERVTLLDQIGFAWDPREEAWSIHYQELKLYIEEIGRMPKSTEDRSLYNWCAKQKKLYQIGRLEKDRETLLLKVCAEIFEDVSEELWRERISALDTFLAEHNRLPRAEERIHDIPIGMWLVEQRSLGCCDQLASDKVAELEAKGLVFLERKERAFWENLELLQAFHKEHHRFPDTTEKYQGFGLGVWCSRVRDEYKLGTLTVEQIEALHNMNFDLRSTNEIRLEKRWDQYYGSVKQFIEENGRLPKGREDQNLYKWVKRQRLVQGSGQLTQEQVKRLQEIAVVR